LNFAKILDKFPIACAYFDGQGKLSAENKAWLELFGADTNKGLESRIKEASKENDYKFEFLHHRQNEHGLVNLVITLHQEEANLVLVCAVEVGCPSEDKRKLELQRQQMYHSNPVPISVWDKQLNPIGCNQAMLDLLEMSSEDEYKESFYKFLPEFQPCGTETIKKLTAAFEEASVTGQSRFLWNRLTTRLEPVTSDTTLVRINNDEGYFFRAYVQDARPILRDLEEERKSHEMTRAILDSSPFVINLWNNKYELVSTSPQAIQMFGLDSERQYIEDFAKLSPEFQPCGTPSTELAISHVKEAFETGHKQFEWIHQNLLGEIIPTEIILVRINRYGENYLLAYTTDLRDVKEAMKKSLEVEAYARKLLDESPMLMEIWDVNGNLIDCNPNMLDSFGIDDKEEFLSRFFEFEPEYQPCGLTSKEKAKEIFGLARKYGYYRCEWLYILGNGEEFPVEITVVPMMYQGEMVFVCYGHDLRPIRKSMKKELESDERASLIVDTMPLSCFMAKFVDENNGKYDFDIIDCNQAALDLFGFSDKEEAVTDFRKIFTPSREGVSAEEVVYKLVRVAYQKGYHSFEYIHQNLRGEPIPCEVILVRVDYKGEAILACFQRDLREEMRREEAEKESKEKTRFLARMSHEIRTPINAVMGIADIQLQKGGHTPETEEAFLRTYNSSRMLLAIINDILDLSKVETGRLEIIPHAYETASLINDTVQLNLMYIGSKQIEFILDIDPNMPAGFVGDELRIKQVLNNLISNAFKYTSRGQVELYFGVEHMLEQGNATLIIRVTDTGQGMTEEQVGRLFEMEFTRFNMQNNRAIEGSGLGMTIVHSLIEMMGGKIVVESEIGKGSVFSVFIPQLVNSNCILDKDTVESLKNLEATKKYLKQAVNQRREPMPYGRVLVVDDVETNLYVAKGFLKPYHLNVETVESGIDAITRVEKGEIYDIIFMDHMMPDMDGIEAIKILRSMGYDHPIVALSANATKEDYEMFMDNGFSGFVSKPIDPSKLDEYLMEMIFDKQKPETIWAARTNYPEKDGDGKESSSLSVRMVESFLLDAKKSISVLESVILQEEIDDGSLRLYTIQAHAMRSALNIIGRTSLSKVAYSLEQASRNEDIPTIMSQTPKFLTALQKVVRGLSPEKIEKTNTVIEDTTSCKDNFLAIAAACEAYYKKDAKNLINLLRQTTSSQQILDLLNEIETYLLLGEFEEAALISKQAADGL